MQTYRFFSTARRLVLCFALTALLLALTALLLALGAPTAALARPSDPPSPAVGARVAPGQTPDGLTAAEWQAVQAAVAAAEYHFAYHNADETHATPYYWAPNRAQGWQTVFSPQGAQVTARGGDWAWGLRLTGYSGVSLAESIPTLTAEQARLTYRWDANLSEWWVNTPQGLEQGFTLQTRPGGRAAGQPLRLEMAVTGSLTPIQRGEAIAFVDADGATVLTYDQLHVTDAAGRALPARLELPSPSQGEGLGVRVVVDDSAARYPLTIDPWVQSAQLTASDGEGGDRFGFSVAVSGDTVVVGAPGDDSTHGSAYVYVKSVGGWITATQTAKLTASDGAADDWFGWSVAVSGDTVVVGAPYDDIAYANQGSAYVYVKLGTVWATTSTYTAKLTAGDGAAYDLFGVSVAVSGETVVVGARGDDDMGADSGSAYVYVNLGTDWATTSTYTAKLTAGDGAANDDFGYSVAVSGDTVVVGARGDDDMGADSGSAYVYVKSVGGWITATQTAKLTASDGAAYDEFGFSVAVSGDTVVVGARWDNIGANTDQGSAYVYVKPGTSWITATQTAKLTAGDGAADDWFGWSVAVSGDTVVVGAYRDDDMDTDSGSAYVYVKPVGGWVNATQTAKLTAGDGEVSDHFGFSVAVSGDTVVVGAFGDDIGANADQGSAYVFNLAHLAHFTLTAQPDRLYANGLDQATLTITATDSGGSGVAFAGQPVTLTLDAGMGTLSAAHLTLDANGVATTTYTAGVIAGTAHLTATIADEGSPHVATATIELQANPLAGRLTSLFRGELITYTFVLTNAGSGPQTVVMSGSIPANTAFVSVTGGAHNATGGDYGAGYVYADNVNLAAGQSHTLVWSVRTLTRVGDIFTEAHAASAQAQLKLTALNRLYRVLLMMIFNNARLTP